jgi:hypothetical protein
MRNRVRRPLRTAVTVLVTVSLLLSWYYHPAAATTDLLLGHDTYGTCSSPAGHDFSLAMDGDDTTYGKCYDGNSYLEYIDLGTAGDPHSFRIKVHATSTAGWCGFHKIDIEANSDPSFASGNVAVYTATGTLSGGANGPCFTVGDGGYDSGEVTFTSVGAYRYWRFRLNGGQDGVAVDTLSLFAGETSVPISTYCINMRVEHPSFQWVGTCSFRIGWHGTLAFASSASSGTIWTNIPGDSGVGHNPGVSYGLTSGYGAGTSGPLEYQVGQDCLPICQSSVITVTITDTDRNQTASFAYLRSADGAVSDPIYRPVFTSWSACYNVTADACDPEFDAAHAYSSGAGTVDIAYTWTCSNGAACDASVGTFTSGQQSRIDPSIISTIRVTHSGQTPGSYVDHGLGVSSGGNPIWMFVVSNELGFSRVTATLNFTTQTTDHGTAATPKAPPIQCGDLDILCGLRSIFAVAGDQALNAVQGGVTSLRSALLSKQPFNFMVRASDGIGTQLSAAQAAVTSTSSCSGLTINLPWSSFAPSTMFPGAPDITFSILKCSDLEPIVGTTWYQAIRTAMDPALYLLFAWHQVQRFRPKPTMNG